MITQNDIPLSCYGVPTKKEHHKIIHAELISRPCKVCHAKVGEECKNLTKGVHMGRVPDGFDSVIFLVQYLNNHQHETNL